jgi:hypothetical protein
MRTTLERPARRERDRVAGVPGEDGGLERRRVGGCPVKPLELERVGHPVPPVGDRTANRAYRVSGPDKRKNVACVAHLVVILGAGASRACSPRGGEVRFLPPLTADLFDSRYEGILHHYPLAEAAAADIRVVVESGAIAIERFLRERLRESSDPYARLRYVQIPLYLHELLTEVSYH